MLYAHLSRMTEPLIECLWFSHTTPLPHKSNDFYSGSFIFYQLISKLKISSHNHLSWHTMRPQPKKHALHSTDHSSIQQCGSHSFQRPHCHTYQYITPLTEIRGPKCSFSVHGHFTCKYSNLVYCISCNQSPTILYIGETRQSLRSHFSKHLQSIRNNTPGFPVAQHFNSTGHNISDIRVRGMNLYNGTNLQHKQHEIRIIFQLGTVHPNACALPVMHTCLQMHKSTVFFHTEEGLYNRNVCVF